MTSWPRARSHLHHLDFVFLRYLDAFGELVHDVPLAPGREELGHLERLGVVGDHPLHEAHIGFGKLNTSEIGGFLRGEQPTRLAGSARLNDRRRCLTLRRAARHERRDDDDGRAKSPERGFLYAHG